MHKQKWITLLIILLGVILSSCGYKISDPDAIIIAAKDTPYYKLQYAKYFCSGSDDQLVINKAIAELGTRGGHVILMEGSYVIKPSIELSSNIHLEGEGTVTIKLAEEYESGVLKALIRNSTEEGNTHITVTNITIKGISIKNPGHGGIYLKNVSNSKIEDCTISSCSFRGIEIFNCDNVTITGCVLENNLDGISVHASQKCTVTNNVARNNEYSGVGLASNTYETTFSSNLTHDNLFGIYVAGKNNAFSNNTCADNKLAGIYVLDSNDNTFLKNSLNGNGNGFDTDSNIILYRSSRNIIKENVIKSLGVSLYGIYIFDDICVENIIEGNNLDDGGVVEDIKDMGSGTVYN